MESVFDQSFSSAMKLLKDSRRLNANLENQLLKYYNERECCAQHNLIKKKGTKGLCRSTSSEQNHLSILVHLNGGEFTRNGYKELRYTLVKDLFNRQRKHVNKWNEKLYNQKVQLMTIRQQINKRRNPCLFEAVEVLCLHSFKKIQEQYNRMSKYCGEKIGESDLCCQVQPISNETAIRRVCKGNDTSSYFVCDTCESSIAHKEQCVHSLVTNNRKFIKEKFSVRHFRRDKVT